MKLSVCLMVRDEEKHLAESVASVLDQEYPGGFELVLAIGPSRDRTEAIARELAAAASNNLEVDPERSILLALQAVDATYASDHTVTTEAEAALHSALQASRVERTVLLGADQAVAAAVLDV